MNNIIEFYVSVDVEGTGPIPGQYSMSSIGAFVAGARLKSGEYIHFGHTDPDNVFYGEMKPLVGSSFTSDAIKVGLLDGFDISQDDPDGAKRWAWMWEHGNEIDAVMGGFVDFVNTHKERLGARPIFMAYPASFDWTFVYWYMHFANLRSPFGFSGVLDLKSYYVGKTGKPFSKAVKRHMPKHLFSNLPHTHRADDDAIEQGIMGMNMLENL